MRLLTLDIETKDPHLKLYGMGSFLGINYPSYDFKVLMVAYMTDDGTVGTTSNGLQLQHLLDTHDAIIGHNLMYDIGGLLYMASQGYIVFDMSKHIFYDTMIFAKLHNQNFFAYGLDYLGQTMVGQAKESSILHDWAWSTGLYQEHHKKETGRACHTRPSDNVLEQWCKRNMDLFPAEVLSQYAIGDIIVTRKLYDKLVERVNYLDLTKFSTILKITIDMKVRGVDIDLSQCRKVSKQFGRWINDAAKKVYEALGQVVEIGKVDKQLGPALEAIGVELPRTPTGKYSIKDEWLAEQEGDIFERLRVYRKALNMKNNFIDKILAYQECIPEEYRDPNRGKLHSTLKLLGAHVTGRFSSGGGSGCKEVSIHQIPVRDETFGQPCRSIFLPYQGETWVHGDFSSQESRLQVHDACLLGCDGAEKIKDKWVANPGMSFHEETAREANVPKGDAKTVNLALTYGLGDEKLIKKLGMSPMQGADFLTRYHTMLPFLKQLQSKCKASLKANRYIKTIGGRKLVIGKRFRGNMTPEKDGLSKRVQGSAADQCMEAMIKAHDAGLKIMIIVHDELNISTANPERDAPILKECMETAMPLLVPVVADVAYGATWLEAK